MPTLKYVLILVLMPVSETEHRSLILISEDYLTTIIFEELPELVSISKT